MTFHRRSARFRGAAVAAVCTFAVAAAFAADGEKNGKPDKAERKIEKAERKSEKLLRMSSGDTPARGVPPPPKSGAPAPAAKAPAAGGGEAARTAATSTAGGGGRDFDPFRPIVEKNIFNPNRTGRTRTVEEAPPPKVDTVALVGTMQSDLGLVAIFDGSDPAFRAAVPVGGEIAGFKVKRILPAGVELSAGERNLTLRMSQQLRRIEGGDWRTTGRDLSRADFGRAEASPSAAPAQPAIPANTSDVVRRLMEQRQKQLKQ